MPIDLDEIKRRLGGHQVINDDLDEQARQARAKEAAIQAEEAEAQRQQAQESDQR